MADMIAALLRERDGYRASGKADRVAQVNEQLAARGYVDDEPVVARPAPTSDPRAQAPKGRRAPGRGRA